ncbi:MAG: hypothetical protein ACQET6_17320 [Bacillota bacterium]|uniref:hypothetical protein n=1 Tax=Rossellomorea TaxID=2837508 RepID=UPI000A78AF80|nr:hypothetical protein [Rossellomorea aquimaris]
MEKAMHGAHGIGYEVYKRKHDVRMQVEKRREQDYKESRRMIAALDRRVHANI